MSGEWLSIETAPKDSEALILLKGGYCVMPGRWWPVDEMWSVDFQPDGWMPLPASTAPDAPEHERTGSSLDWARRALRFWVERHTGADLQTTCAALAEIDALRALVSEMLGPTVAWAGTYAHRRDLGQSLHPEHQQIIDRAKAAADGK